MKKTFLFVFALGSILAQGQQLPLYANYFFAPQMTNPATSGADGFSELTTMSLLTFVFGTLAFVYMYFKLHETKNFND